MAEKETNPLAKVTERIQFLGDTYRGYGDLYGHIAVKFQSGPITEENPENGVQIEDVLELGLHRLLQLDEKLSCEENKTAAEAIAVALEALNARTAKRVAEGVEGTEKAHSTEKTEEAEESVNRDDIP